MAEEYQPVPPMRTATLVTRAILRDEGAHASEGDDIASHVADCKRRALVTRPRAEAAALAEALAARGIEAILEPLLEIDYRGGPVPELGGVQALLCTSANGVRALARLVDDRELPLLAVGEATAARARAEGFAHVESAGGDVEDLACLAAARLRPEAGRLLHVAGSAVAGDLAGTLGRRGFQVERAVLYEARPAVRLGAATVAAFAGGEIDFALFFSPRTAAIFAELVGAAAIGEALRDVTAISLSAAADAALSDLSFAARRIAERPDQNGLLAALDPLLAERRCR